MPRTDYEILYDTNFTEEEINAMQAARKRRQILSRLALLVAGISVLVLVITQA